jgi:hypothetical protein
MNIITYVKDIPLMKKVFGFALISFGLAGIIGGSLLFGVIFISLGSGMMLTEGAQINITTRRYRKIKSIFGLEFGTWEPYPDFEYVSVFKTKESQTVNVVTASATSTSDIILLNLFYNRNKHVTVYKTNSIDDAFKVAEHLKLALKIDVLDATTREKKWLD